jgi:hypothetical protein
MLLDTATMISIQHLMMSACLLVCLSAGTSGAKVPSKEVHSLSKRLPFAQVTKVLASSQQPALPRLPAAEPDLSSQPREPALPSQQTGQTGQAGQRPRDPSPAASGQPAGSAHHDPKQAHSASGSHQNSGKHAAGATKQRKQPRQVQPAAPSHLQHLPVGNAVGNGRGSKHLQMLQAAQAGQLGRMGAPQQQRAPAGGMGAPKQGMAAGPKGLPAAGAGAAAAGGKRPVTTSKPPASGAVRRKAPAEPSVAYVVADVVKELRRWVMEVGGAVQCSLLLLLLLLSQHGVRSFLLCDAILCAAMSCMLPAAMLPCTHAGQKNMLSL